MNDVKGSPGEVTFTVTIIRKATGLTETYDMVGHVVDDPQLQPIEGTSQCQQQ
jgi:hypothetical protein